jgi:hypothetical protein
MLDLAAAEARPNSGLFRQIEASFAIVELVLHLPVTQG